MSWLFWLVCISLALSFAITSIPIQTELPLLLPSSGSFSEQLFVDQIQSGPTSRILLLGLRGAEPSFLAESSKKLAKAMRDQGLFLHVYNGEQTNLDSDRDLLFQYRYLFSPTVSPINSPQTDYAKFCSIDSKTWPIPFLRFLKS